MSSILSWVVGASPRAANPLDDRYYQNSRGVYAAGQVVSPETGVHNDTVFRCVSILANSAAWFPKGMFEFLERGRRPAPEHPLDRIIGREPNNQQSAFEFWRLFYFHLILRGNVYVQIVPGPAGRGWVGQLVLLHPDRVKGPEVLPSGRRRYEYTTPSNEKIPMIGGIDIWHVSGLSADGLRGLSMMDLASDSIGISMAAERHAARFFERGVKATGVLQHPNKLTTETAKEMGESFSRAYGGEAGAGRTPVLWDKMIFQPISLNLKDQEFLDSRKFSVTQIARWFGVPPHMVGDVERSTSWGTGIEQQGLHFLIYSLAPWIALVEQSIRNNLVVQSERYYPKFNVNALLRMDAKAQADVFSVLIDKGVLSPNECRELLDRNPRDGGDEYVDVAAPPAPPPAAPQLPQDNTPPDPQPGPQDAAGARAGVLAKAQATELVAEEGRALEKLAKDHMDSIDGFRSAVAGFYGRFAGRVASALSCSKSAAKQWCETRRGIVIGEGLLGLDGATQEAVEALTAMALGGE